MIDLYKHLGSMQGMEDQVREWWAIRHTREGRKIATQSQETFSRMSVARGGGVNPHLFTRQDESAKTAHNADVTDKAEQIVQYWLPHRLSQIINVCPWSTKGCRATCLHASGQLRFHDTAKFVRVELFVVDPFAYMVVMLTEIEQHARRVAKCGKVLVIRPNGTADAPWEMLLFLFDLVASLNLGATWFDYTKGILTTARRNRVPSPLPNYYTVASATEATTPEAVADYPHNVVAVVDVPRGKPLPETMWGRQVVDGDRHDLRPFDPQIAALVLVRAKGDARKAPSGPNRFVKAV
jgi:hypothetical protein